MIKNLKSKKGIAITSEYLFVIVVVVLVVALALGLLGSKMSSTVEHSATSISKETACGLVHGKYDAVAGTCTANSKSLTWNDSTGSWS